jgi:hypothetical protein
MLMLCCTLQEVDKEMAVAYAEEIGALYLETSAKDDTNVQDIFVKLSKCMWFMSLILSVALSAALVVLSTSHAVAVVNASNEADWNHRIVRVLAKDVICPAAFCVWRCTTAITYAYSDVRTLSALRCLPGYRLPTPQVADSNVIRATSNTGRAGTQGGANNANGGGGCC